MPVAVRSLTWVQAVAADGGPLQPVGQLSGEQHVAQLAVAVGLEAAPSGIIGNQVFPGRQEREVDTAETVQESGHGDHAAGPALPQPLQQQIGQQEVTQVVHAKSHPKSVLGASRTHHT